VNENKWGFVGGSVGTEKKGEGGGGKAMTKVDGAKKETIKSPKE